MGLKERAVKIKPTTKMQTPRAGGMGEGAAWGWDGWNTYRSQHSKLWREAVASGSVGQKEMRRLEGSGQRVPVLEGHAEILTVVC